MTIEVWHSHNTRSLRIIWALAEMGIPHKIHNLAFPPRAYDESFLEKNPLGTVPFFTDGRANLTESSATLLYLAETYPEHELGVDKSHSEYGLYLNFLFQSDATLTFPQTLVLRYSQFETKERQNQQVTEDYKIWFLARLKLVNQRLENHSYLAADKFTMADIAVGYALYLGELLGLSQYFKEQTYAYLERLKQRSAFIDCVEIGKEVANYKILPIE